jgi:D-glycero-alpha-D-manno-heptose 1-phosphate guanylyltransferase
MSRPLAVVLAGGLGTRVRHLLPDLPKPLASVAGRPFLEWALRYLRAQGVRKAVLSAGHYAEKIEQFAGALKLQGLEVTSVKEAQPLGTAGGFLHALQGSGDTESDVLVCNGDSLVLADLKPLFSGLEKADGAVLGVQVSDAARFGTLKTGADHRLIGFEEKRPGSGLINGGVYLFRRATIARFPQKRPLSFEYDVFPALVSQGLRIHVVSCKAPFLDIGTEETLAEADGFIRKHMEWFE